MHSTLYKIILNILLVTGRRRKRTLTGTKHNVALNWAKNLKLFQNEWQKKVNGFTHE